MKAGNVRRKKADKDFWLRREQRRFRDRRELAKEEEALATQRIRKIKAIHFAAARYKIEK